MGSIRPRPALDPRPRPERAAAQLLDGGPDARGGVQTVTVADETPEMLALAAADPLIAAVVGWTDLTAPSVGDDLAGLCAGPGGRYLASIRHQVQSEPERRTRLVAAQRLRSETICAHARR